VILSTFIELGAQPSTWQNYWGGYNMEVGNAIQQTSDSGFIIAGATFSFGAGLSDVYLIKTDSRLTDYGIPEQIRDELLKLRELHNRFPGMMMYRGGGSVNKANSEVFDRYYEELLIYKK